MNILLMMRPFPLSLAKLLVLIAVTEIDTNAFTAKSNKRRVAHRHQLPTPRPKISIDSFAHSTALDDNIDILPAPDGKGMGAFTSVPILSGVCFGNYKGEYMTRKEVEARYWEKRKPNRHDRKWRNSRKRRNQGLTGDYMFELGDDIFLDGEDADVSSWCRFANHASPGDVEGERDECNTVSMIITKTSEGELLASPELWFRALRDIDIGEEICYDYGGDYWKNDDLVRNCDTKSVIRGREYNTIQRQSMTLSR